MSDIFLKSWFSAHSQSSYLPFFISISLSVTVHLSALFYPTQATISTEYSESENNNKTINVRLLPARNLIKNSKQKPENNMEHKSIYKFKKSLLTSIKSYKKTATHVKVPDKKLITPIHNNKNNKLKKLDIQKPSSEIELTKLNSTRNQQASRTVTTSTVSNKKIAINYDLKQAPNLEFSVAPEFPSEARWESRTGSTVLKYQITLLGKVKDIKIKRTSGHQDLDSSAIDAIKQWRYKRIGINPLNWYQYTFHFRLE